MSALGTTRAIENGLAKAKEIGQETRKDNIRSRSNRSTTNHRFAIAKIQIQNSWQAGQGDVETESAKKW
jgi:hypothetical protein